MLPTCTWAWDERTLSGRYVTVVVDCKIGLEQWDGWWLLVVDDGGWWLVPTFTLRSRDCPGRAEASCPPACVTTIHHQQVYSLLLSICVDSDKQLVLLHSQAASASQSSRLKKTTVMMITRCSNTTARWTKTKTYISWSRSL